MKTRTKVGIGALVALVLIVTFGLWARSAVRDFFYPVAPQMPAEVAEPMNEILTRLEQILQTNAPHVLAELQPGLRDPEITRLENQNGVKLPEDIRVIYRWHNGSLQATNGRPTAFLPIHRFIPLEEALTERPEKSAAKAGVLARMAYRVFAGHRDSWIALFSDGAGDGYWYDPRRPAAQGAVFYNFTETGSFVFFPSPKNLMAGIAKCYSQGVFHVKKDLLRRNWMKISSRPRRFGLNLEAAISADRTFYFLRS